jgi:putative membrane protein
MKIIIKLLINGFAVWVASMLIPGVKLTGFLAAVVVGFLLAVVNTFVKPILLILTLPATILTMGLFIFVINALMVLLVQWILPEFNVGGFWNALLFSIALTAIKFLIDLVVE